MKALSAYNTGDFARGVKNGYVQKVSTNGIKIAQGYTVPAIKLDPQDIAPSPSRLRRATCQSHGCSASAERERQIQDRPKTPAGGSTTTEPSMVFGTPPAGANEAAQALVF